jgi:hypothetical protein
MRQAILTLIVILFLVQCKGQDGLQDQLVNKPPYDTIFECTDSLSVKQIKKTDKFIEFLINVPMSQISGEFYVIENTDNLRQVKGNDFSVNWTQWFTIIKDKQNRILKIQYNCDTSQNIGYSHDYFYNESGRLILIISNSTWVSPDHSKAIQEEIRYYFGYDAQIIKKTYDLHNPNKEKLSKEDNIFSHKAFPIYWTDREFIDFYKIKN